jgi:TetR/AcrR family transcriptional regulator, regulator of cefoperazone and chloramphenicol sensitivity
MAYASFAMRVPASDLNTAARVRNAALEGFARDGVAATSIRDVAKAAGVSPGLVQHHFPNKAALAAAVNEHVGAIAISTFADVPTAGSAEDAAEELGRRVAALVRDHPDALRYVARATVEGDPGALELFDGFVAIAESQWRRVASDGLLREDLDMQWLALNTVMFNLAPLLFATALERQLSAPLTAPGVLERWRESGTALFRHGVYRGRGVQRKTTPHPRR